MLGYEGGGGEIVYEQNGNMIAMPDKGISNISYNFLNLPMQITQNDNTTDYLYRTDGVKLKKVFTLNNADGGSVINTEYLDGFQYSTPNTEPLRLALQQADESTTSAVTASEAEAFTALADRAIAAPIAVIPGTPAPEEPLILSFFPTAEGYYDYENMRYIYQYKDQLGNVRLSFTKNKYGVITMLDRNDYYPFGMSFLKTGLSAYDPMAIPYNYKFQGQELQETGFYSFKWRNYMPDVGRFFNVDKLSEQFPYNSVYAFQENKIGLGRELEGLELLQERGMIMATGMTSNDIYTREPLPSYMSYLNYRGESPAEQGMTVKDMPSMWYSGAENTTASKALGVLELVKLADDVVKGIEGIKETREMSKAVNYKNELVGELNLMETAQNVVNKADLKLDNQTKTEITNYVFDGSLPKDISSRPDSVIRLDSKTNIVNTANSIMKKNDITIRNSPEVKQRTELDEAARQHQEKLQNIGQ